MKAFLTIMLTMGFIKQVSAECDPSCLPDEVCQSFVETIDATASPPVTFSASECVCNSTIYGNPDFISLLEQLSFSCGPGELSINITECAGRMLNQFGFLLPDDNPGQNPCLNRVMLMYPGIATYSFNLTSSNPNCVVEISTNSTYLTYGLPVWYRNDVSGQEVIFYNDIIVNYTCSFPLIMNASLDVSFNPMSSPDRLTTGRYGSYILTMQLFKFSDFTGSYSVSDLPIQFRLGKLLHIGASVMGLDPKFSVKVVSCYATPTSDPDDPIKYFFISDSCPVAGFIQLTFLKDGNGPAVYFSMKVFKLGSYPRVHVHCAYSICEGVCEPSCSSR